MAELKQSGVNYRDQVIMEGEQDLSLESEEIEQVNTENAPTTATGSDSESSECATDAFKEAFLETQRKLINLEEELRGTRQYLCCLEEACESTEQKISELKNAPVQDERDVSIAEENRNSNVSLEDYAAVLESLETEREQAEDVRIRVARLENKLEDTSSEISRLLSQLDTDKQVDSDAKDMRDNAAELRDEITMMKDDCTLYCSRIAKLTEENEALKKDKTLSDALLREVKTLKNECDEIESENEQLEKEKQSLREELGALEAKLASLESNQVQRDKNVDEAVSNTQNKLTNAENCLEQLKQQVLDHNEQVQELEDSCDQSRARNIELEKELSTLHIRIQDLENSLDADEKEKQEFQAEWKKRGVQMENQLRDVGREKEFLRLQLTDCKGKAEIEARNLTKQLNEAQVRCEIFKKEVAEKERELQACRRDTERCNNEFSALEKQLEGANDDIARLQEVNKRLEDELYSLTGQRAEKVDFPQETKPTSSPPPLAEGESDLSDFEEEIVVAKRDLVVEATPEQVEGSDSETGGQAVEEMLRHALEDKKDLEQKLAEAEQSAEQTAGELSETIRRLNDRCDELSRELTDKVAGNVDGDSNKALELEEQLKQLREENEHLQEEIEKAQSHHELAATEVPEDGEVLEEKYESLKKAYDELLSESENLQEEHEKLVEEKDVLLEEVEEWQNDFEAGKQKYDKLTSENENLKDVKKKLEKQVLQLQEELTKKGDVCNKEMENQLKSQRAKIAERLKRLKAETESSEDSFDKEDDAVSEWREMYSTLRTRFDQIERAKISLERDRDRLARKCNNVEDELEEVRGKYSRVRREVSDAHGEVSNLRQLLSEHRAAKDSAERKLKKQEEKCEKHLKELDNITWQVTRDNSDGGLMVKFESLKLKFEELEGEKETLKNETNNLQYKLHTAEEKTAENEAKLHEANEEKQRLEQELKQSQTANTELEVVLEKTIKEKEQEEKQCEWYQNELAKKEAMLNDLEQKLRHLETEMKFESGKSDDKQGEADELRARVALLEQEIERLNEEVGAKREQDEVDSGSLRTRVAELETSLETLKADLESKDLELEKVEKEKDSLSHHTVELKREIQCLYKRFEATQAQVAELQSLPQAVTEIPNEAPLQEAQVSDVQSAPPPEPQKVEKTEMTIDVESKPDVGPDVPVTIAGLERKVSIVNIPVNIASAVVRNGNTPSVTEEPEGPIQVSGSSGMLQSEPDDDVFPPPPMDELILSDEQFQTYSSPPYAADEQTTPMPTPERIRVSAQALPQPQVPRSLDTRRFPFLTDGVTQVGSGAYRPVPVQSRMIPDERRQIHDYGSRDGRYFPDNFRPLPGRHQRARSEPGDIGKIRDLEDEPLFRATAEDRRGQEQRVPPRPRLPDYYPPAESFESPRGQARDPYDRPSEYDDGQRKGPRMDRPRAEVNPYEVRPREVRQSPEYSTPHGPMIEGNRQRPPPPRGKELYPYAKQPRSPNSHAEQRIPPPYEHGYQRPVEHRQVPHDPGQSGLRGPGTSPRQQRLNQSPRANRETPDKPYYVRDEKAAYPSYEHNGHYDSRSVTGGQRIAPDQGYGTIDGQHLLAERLRQDYSNAYLRDSYMYMGGVDL